MLFTRWGESICVFNLLYVLNVNSGGQEFQEVRRAGGQGFRRCRPGDHQVRGTGQELGRPGVQDGWEFSRSRTGQEAFKVGFRSFNYDFRRPRGIFRPSFGRPGARGDAGQEITKFEGQEAKGWHGGGQEFW